MNEQPRQPFTIRPMVPADVPAVVAIDRLSFPTPWPASAYMYEILESGHSFYQVLVRVLADRAVHPRRRWYERVRDVFGELPSDEVTGYVGFRVYRTEAHISTIAIHPDWRGKGLGESLLLVTIQRVHTMGAHRVTLEVRASNQVAQRLYEKYGFKFTGTHKRYYSDGEDAWLMATDVNGNGYKYRLHALRDALDSRLLSEHICVGQEAGDRV